MLGDFYYFLIKITHFEAYVVQCCSLYESGCTLVAQNKQNNLKTAEWHKLFHLLLCYISREAFNTFTL